MTSKKSDFILRAKSFVNSLFIDTMPPKALTGSV